MWPPLLGKGGMGGGAGGGRSGGGGGGGSGGMMRTVQRPVRGSVKDPFSHSSSTASNTSRHTCNKRGKKHSDVLCLSSSITSSPFPSFNHSVSSDSEGLEWECVDGSEFERGFDFYDDFVFGPVPSKDEVQFAVSSLLQALNPASSSKSIEDRLAYESDKDVPDETTSPLVMVKRVSSVGTELDWIEPLPQCSPRMSQPYGSDRVYDAFHLLQTEPCIQRMVASLSTDKAVWDAVLKNEVVQELRESLSQAENENGVADTGDGGSHGSDAATNILSWIFDNTKAKVTELIQKITNLMNALFQPQEDEQATTGDTNAFNSKLRASIFLTIVVLFIVVGDRCHK